MQVTIHRALSELKLIDKKIEKKIGSAVFAGVRKAGKPVNGMYGPEEFEKNAISAYESITALLSRKQKIKTAVIQSNAATMVTIAGEKMTVADAITKKAMIGQHRVFLDKLSRDSNKSKVDVRHHNIEVEQQALKIAEVALGKDNVEIKDDDAQRVISGFINANSAVIVDPIGIDKKIEEMEESISNFESEVDAVLSESNALTVIDI